MGNAHLCSSKANQFESLQEGKANDPTGPLEIVYDGRFIALAPGSAAYKKHKEMVFDVSMWKYQIGNHLVLVKGSLFGKTRMRGGGRDFVIHEDGTISPKPAQHLVLGARYDGALALFPKGAPEAVMLAAVNPRGNPMARVPKAAAYRPGPLCSTSLVLSSHAGKAIVPRWKQTRNACSQWDYIDLGVGPAKENDPTGTLKVLYDGQFIALAPGSTAYAMHQEMVFGVSMWNYQIGNHLILVKVDPRNAKKDSTRKRGGGRDFMIHEDGTISPRRASHLVLGCRHDGALALFLKGAPEAVVLAAVNPSGKVVAAQGLGTTENDEEKMYQSPKQKAHPPSRSFRARTSKNRVLFSVLASPTQNSENAIGSVTHSLGPNRLGRTSLMLACPHAGKAIVPRWKETRSFNEWNYIELDVGPANDNDPSCKPKRSTCEEVGETEGERYRGEEEEGMPTKITKM